MTEVTQADREAYLSLSMLPEFDAADVRAGRWDKTTGLRAFAAHRIASDRAGYERGQRETVERIVAWLRKCQKAKLNHHAEVCHREDDDVLDAIVTAMNTFAYAADAIEAGEWK